jgi:benzoate-CoA ligase
MPDAPVASPPERFNFADFLLETNAGRRDAIAYVDDHERVRYGDLADRIRRLAAGLEALGVRREERVLLAMHDCADWPVAFLGALYAGIIPVAVNTLLTADDYAFMLADSRAQAVITCAPLLPTITAALARADHEVRHLVVSRPGGAAAADVVAFDALRTASGVRTAPAATRRDDLAFWLYSSGSTGRPKAAVHTHANPYWTAKLYGQAILGIGEHDIVFSAAKLFFAYGLGNALSFPLSVGATVVLMAERPTPEAVFRRLTEHRATIFCGAPTGYAAMLASPQLPAPGSTALRLCSSAGEALPADIGRRTAAHFGCDVVDGLGSTEMLHIFVSNRPGDVRYGSSGTPVPGYEVEIRDDAGRAVAPGELGELFVKGPSAAVMYWGDRDRSRATFQGEWVRTGDKYVRDADGWFTYAGRTDDMLKVSGVYVSPFEVEAALVQHPAVLEAAVIGITDDDGLNKTKAFVVLTPGHDACAALGDELKAFVKQRLAAYKYPRQIEFVGELPKTATGKIQRFRLREREAGRAVTPR